MLKNRLRPLILPDEFVVLDIETTGLNVTNDRIIEIAAVKYNKQAKIDTLSTLINPHKDIPKVVIGLTGITQQDVDFAPTWADVQSDFLAFIGNAPLVGHNIIDFDITFINAALGYELPNLLIDTLNLARYFFPSLPNYKLENIKKIFHIDVPGSHRALADSLATYELLLLCTDPEHAQERIDYSACTNENKSQKHRNSVKIGDIMPSPDAAKNSVLKGKTLVFTGSLSIERKEAMQIAVDAGAIVRTTVSKKTNYLVVGQQDLTLVGFEGTSEKERDAQRINETGAAHIEIIDEQTFIALTQTEGQEDPHCENQKNPPSPDEISAFEILKTNCFDLLQNLNIPSEFLLLKGVTEKSAACILDESHLLTYIRIRKSKKYITFPEDVASFIPAEIKKYELKSTPGIVYAAISDVHDIEKCTAAFCETIRQHMQKYHTFDCCSRYMECSNERKCIHPNPADALGCTYKKHLVQGRIFYGKNRNID